MASNPTTGLYGWSEDVGNTAKELGDTSVLGTNKWFRQEKFDIIQSRDATFLSKQAEENAHKNIRGGSTTNYDESNLYGFAIFEFTGGFGNGWGTANIESILGNKSSVTNFLTGGDRIANVTSYFFNVHPSSINLTEPFATQITPTQLGGYYDESQGVLLRNLTITGTTGYRPAGNGVLDVETEDTGFLNFIKLRNLFRNYSDSKKSITTAHKTYMVFYDGHYQEAWFCEPTLFSGSKVSSFLNKYEIQVVLLKKLYFSAAATTLDTSLFNRQTLNESMRIAALGLSDPDFTLASYVKAMRSVSTGIDSITKLIRDTTPLMRTAVLGGIAVGLSPILPAVNIVQSAKDLIFESGAAFNTLFSTFSSISREEIWASYGMGIQSSFTDIVRTYSRAFRLFLEDEHTVSSSIATIQSQKNSNTPDLPEGMVFKHITVPSNLPTLESLSKKYTGNSNFTDWIIQANGLRYPYFSKAPKDGTAYPGMRIIVPVLKATISKPVETFIFFNSATDDIETDILGRDIKLSIAHSGNGVPQFGFLISESGDLDTTYGLDNLKQALKIKIYTERGSLPMHPTFGLISTVGMRANLNLIFATYLAVNDTMLSDGRVEALSGLDIRATGDLLSIKMKAHIVGQSSSVPVGFSLGA